MTSSYPLNCYSGLSKDDFAGWYAVNDKFKCNDFCFWKQSDEYYHQEQQQQQQQNDGVDNLNSSSTSSSSTLLKYSTADPHQTTIISKSNNVNAKWVCLLDSTSDEIMFDTIFQKNNETANIIVFHDENVLKFDSLRCSRGAGEILHSNGQIVLSSIYFWSIVIFVCIITFVWQIVYFIIWKRERCRRITFESIINDNELHLYTDVTEKEEYNPNGQGTIEPKIVQNTSTCIDKKASTIDPSPQENQSTWKSICSKSICLTATFAIIDIILLYAFFTAILVITEIDQQLDLPFSLQVLTPLCLNTELVCPDANIPIDNESKSLRNETLPTENNIQSFSYIIASDSQLDWYDGESAYIGQMIYPPPCSSRDSCMSCTKKLGLYTNEQMKKSIEKLINMKREKIWQSDSNTNEYSNYPLPKTLIMNGDLTQYFHRHERKKYESIYHNIEGLEQYFPSLGNHDYDQKNGGTYNNNEWIGPHYCNGKHAVSYFKGAFCNKIPKFDAKTRLTRYDPKSLSYSWEEGLYHFVEVHYYPTFENAGLGISSSVEWLERDLRLANEQNLTSILFVHASGGLTDILEETLLDNNVAAIFTGHLHRCLGRKCELMAGLNSYQAEKFFNSTMTNSTPVDDSIGQCFPSSAILCSRYANGNGLFYVKDIEHELRFPEWKLFSKVPAQRGLCPVSKYGPYLNETANTSLCRQISIRSHFPSKERMDNRSIPIFWSGSASYETFLVADFHHDRIVINVMTAGEGNEGERYVDVHSVPNAVYPFHQRADLEEQTIFI